MLCSLLGTGVVATVDSSCRTGVLSIYHVKCEILVSHGRTRCDVARNIANLCVPWQVVIKVNQ